MPGARSVFARMLHGQEPVVEAWQLPKGGRDRVHPLKLPPPPRMAIQERLPCACVKDSARLSAPHLWHSNFTENEVLTGLKDCNLHVGSAQLH